MIKWLLLFRFRGFDSVLAVMNDFDMEKGQIFVKQRQIHQFVRCISSDNLVMTLASETTVCYIRYVTLVTLWNNSIWQYCIVRNYSGISDTCVLTCLWVKFVTLTKLECLIMKNLSNQWFEDLFSQLLDFRSLFDYYL